MTLAVDAQRPGVAVAPPAAEIELTRSCSTDSPRLDGTAVLSGANFREVSPEIISPLSFSLIGAGMEQAFRRIAGATGERRDGERPNYVAYIAHRPYHVMSRLDAVIERLPLMARDDVWELLLGGPPPPAGTLPELVRRTRRMINGARAGQLLLVGNGRFADEACELVATAESHVLAARSGGTSFQVGAALERSFVACRHSWALHTRTTTLATGVAGALRALLRRDHDEATATEILRQVARRASEATHASASASRLPDPGGRLQSYEVADGSDRFARFGLAASTPTTSSPARNRRLPEELALITATWAGRGALRVTELLETLLAERERSKELGLRALHAVRCALETPDLGLAPGDAAMLSTHELMTLGHREREGLIAHRSDELEQSAAIAVSADLREDGERLVEIRRPRFNLEVGATGTPLAPGWAEGDLVSEASGGGGEDDILYGARVDGNYVLAARPAGVVSTFGSLLSHVAIVCRELGIPLVSNVDFDERLLGRRVNVDGWSGEVTTS